MNYSVSSYGLYTRATHFYYKKIAQLTQSLWENRLYYLINLFILNLSHFYCIKNTNNHYIKLSYCRYCGNNDCNNSRFVLFSLVILIIMAIN